MLRIINRCCWVYFLANTIYLNIRHRVGSVTWWYFLNSQNAIYTRYIRVYIYVDRCAVYCCCWRTRLGLIELCRTEEVFFFFFARNISACSRFFLLFLALTKTRTPSVCASSNFCCPARFFFLLCPLKDCAEMCQGSTYFGTEYSVEVSKPNIVSRFCRGINKYSGTTQTT